MFIRFIAGIWTATAGIGIDPADELEIRLQKNLYVRSILFCAVPIGSGYGLHWLTAGEPLAGFVLTSWSMVFIGNVVMLGIFPHHHSIWIFLGLLSILLMPFSLVLALGV